MTGRRLAWWVGILGGTAASWALRSGPLQLPAPWHVAAFTARIDVDGAAVGAVAMLRQVVLLAGLYLLALGLVAEATRLPGLARILAPALRLPVPGRRLVFGALGVPALVVTTALAVAPVAGASPPPGTGAPTLRWLGPVGGPPSLGPGTTLVAPGSPAGGGPGLPRSPGSRGGPGSAGGPVPSGDAPVLRWVPDVPAPSGVPVSSGGPASSGGAGGTGAWPGSGPGAAAPAAEGGHPAAAGWAAVPGRSAAPAPAGGQGGAGQGGAGPGGAGPGGSAIASGGTTPVAGGAAAGPPSPAPTAHAAPGVRPAGATALRPDAGAAALRPIPATYTLVAGDHLWKVAEATLTTALGHPPAEEQLAQYWWRLVETNRPSLPDPSDPDFVLPGMVVVLPPIVP